MALSPLDIRNKTFSTKMRGFNQDEVDDFLDQVINDYEEVIRQKREIEKSLKHSEEKLTYFNELKDALNQSIIVAQDTADKLKENATKESTIIITTAEAEAKDILTKAREEAKRTVEEANASAHKVVTESTAHAQQLASETDDLKKKTRTFHRNLTMLLENQLDMVKSEEWDELLKPFSTYVSDDHKMVKEVLTKELDKENENHVESSQVIEETEVVAEPDLDATATFILPTDNNDSK
ncbi:DivIVA domain-containing protein [Vagococcus entomophilus]|uniref:Cell division protein DivIVA n=1 Tax=Vagococcus entomophilus TaxID=1160095 RepID=A0A430AI95_9ENTE|nr:DivIVA domain-containing protein [Vagococcus entomophilus]RSU07839.1 cell division protein DivIVA [Vagococcus entomophilus]